MWVLASQLFSLWLSPPIGEVGKEIEIPILENSFQLNPQYNQDS